MDNWTFLQEWLDQRKWDMWKEIRRGREERRDRFSLSQTEGTYTEKGDPFVSREGQGDRYKDSLGHGTDPVTSRESFERVALIQLSRGTFGNDLMTLLETNESRRLTSLSSHMGLSLQAMTPVSLKPLLSVSLNKVASSLDEGCVVVITRSSGKGSTCPGLGGVSLTRTILVLRGALIGFHFKSHQEGTWTLHSAGGGGRKEILMRPDTPLPFSPYVNCNFNLKMTL